MSEEIKFEYVERIKSNTFFGDEKTKLPERNTKSAAGYDFYYLDDEPVLIQPKEIQYVKTGIKAAFPENMVLQLYNRSSNPKKKSLILINGVGIVDSDYYNNEDNEGEIAFAFYNIKDEPVIIMKGDKLGQGIFTKYYPVTNEEEIEKERTGGFGSTGK